MRAFMKSIGLGVASLALLTSGALAQTKQIKIGLIFDQTGPFAGGGSVAASLGSKIRHRDDERAGRRRGLQDRPDLRRRPVESRYRHQRGRAAAQRAEGRHADGRLLDRPSAFRCRQGRCRQEVLVGDGVHLVGRVSRTRTSSTSSAVTSTPISSARHRATCFERQNSKAKFGMEPKDLKVAIIHEDGPYGVGVAQTNESSAKSTASRSCTGRLCRNLDGLCRRWSPSCAGPGPT